MIQIDMEMPGKCSECRFNIKTGGYSKDGNLVAVDFCSLQYQGYEQGNEDRPEWCPLKEAAAGHWIYDDIANNWRCDKCGETPKTMGYVGTGKFMAEHFKFCNHCGVRMVEQRKGARNDQNCM